MSFAIDPIILATPQTRVRSACGTLRALGMTYTEEDLQRFPVLHEPDPCSAVR